MAFRQYKKVVFQPAGLPASASGWPSSARRNDDDRFTKSIPY
jgi:hypothetical protein